MNGLLTNMKQMIARSAKKFRTSKYIYLREIPSLIFIINSNEFSSRHIFHEISNLSLISIKIIDGSENPKYYPYWIPGNTKSPYSQQFYLTLMMVFLNKLLVVRHKSFFKKLLKITKNAELE